MNPNDYIPKPCHENWNTMSGDEKRKFCEKCSTHVHDLTDKSDEEIRTMHRANGGKLCGSFSLRNSLALGSGIASLALASCESKKGDGQGVPVVGIVCAPPEQTDHGDTPKKKPEPKKQPAVEKPKPIKQIEVPERPEILLGEICPPAPENFPQA